MSTCATSHLAVANDTRPYEGGVSRRIVHSFRAESALLQTEVGRSLRIFLCMRVLHVPIFAQSLESEALGRRSIYMSLDQRLKRFIVIAGTRGFAKRIAADASTQSDVSTKNALLSAGLKLCFAG